MIERERGMRASEAALMNAYIDGNLSTIQKAEVESLIATNAEAAKTFREKSEARQNLQEFIPRKKLSRESLSLLKAELRGVNEDLFPDQKLSIGRRFAKLLDTTILEF